MERIVMAIRIAPKTREKLEAIKEKTGLSYGIIIDTMVNGLDTNDKTKIPIEFLNIPEVKEETYTDKPY